MKTALSIGVLAVACLALPATPARAQTAPFISLRPFVDVSAEQFAATQTFKSVFGQSVEPLYGGGLELTIRDRYYVDVAASRFRKSADRVFRNNGQVFHLGIPLTTTITPFELTGGYRFHLYRHGRPLERIIPYAGGGVGWYSYKETSQFADDAENLDTRHAGLVLTGGAEFRLHRWVGVAADLQYTHVPGILGAGGLSQLVGEKDLGGIAGRVKIVVGK
jgi:hypothetical protein